MEGPQRTTQEAKGTGRRRELALVALLVLLAAGVRVWVVRTTEVPARDSIGFIRYALAIQECGWRWTLHHQHQHPGYPLCILAVSLPVRHLAGLDCDSMQLSAQLASSLAGLLLVIPMYYLGKYLLDRGAGFWGALLFQCLPASGRALSDAISDPLFLLLLASGLALAVRALRRRSPAGFGLAGALGGLAYLTRPEGVLLVPAAGLALALAQCVPAWRRPWRTALACGAGLALGALVTGSPYFLTVGHFTNKPNAGVLTGKQPGATEEDDDPAPAGTAALTSAPQPYHVGNKEEVQQYGQMPVARRVGQATWTLAAEFVQCYQYVGWLPVLLGAWWFRGRYRVAPEVWVVVLLFALDALLLWLLVVRAGYLSGRHVLVLVLCTVFQAAVAVRELPYQLAAWWRRLAERAPGRRPLWLSPAAWSLVLLLLLAGTGLSRTLRPLHSNRAGHRAAGRWLAANARPWDEVEDNHGWAFYYANRLFLSEAELEPPPGCAPRHYVVVNRSNDKKSPTRTPAVSETALHMAGGRVVYSWPEGGPAEQARVLVYRVP
jgi:4-amino-4-deoxy-L-arabinose transferase-like glycosyltransferase